MAYAVTVVGVTIALPSQPYFAGWQVHELFSARCAPRGTLPVRKATGLAPGQGL